MWTHNAIEYRFNGASVSGTAEREGTLKKACGGEKPRAARNGLCAAIGGGEANSEDELQHETHTARRTGRGIHRTRTVRLAVAPEPSRPCLIAHSRLHIQGDAGRTGAGTAAAAAPRRDPGICATEHDTHAPARQIFKGRFERGSFAGHRRTEKWKWEAGRAGRAGTRPWWCVAHDVTDARGYPVRPSVARKEGGKAEHRGGHACSRSQFHFGASGNCAPVRTLASWGGRGVWVDVRCHDAPPKSFPASQSRNS